MGGDGACEQSPGCVRPNEAIVGLRAFADLKEEPARVRTCASARARADAFAGLKKEPACAYACKDAVAWKKNQLTMMT